MTRDRVSTVNGGAGKDSSDTYADRDDKYKRRTDTILRLLAALGALALVGTGDLAGTVLGNSPAAALVVSLLLVTGATLGSAWASFVWAHTCISRAIANKEVEPTATWDRKRYYVPTRGERLYKLGTVLLPIVGITIATSFWVRVC